jgi:hypothetical protein
MYTIKETSVWGDVSKARNSQEVQRLMKKKSILQRYPFVDHYKLYAYKLIGQKGPAKESQTFLISYAYIYDTWIGDRENLFIDELHEIDLQFYKDICLYNGKQAYKIMIYDTDVDSLAVREEMY